MPTVDDSTHTKDRLAAQDNEQLDLLARTLTPARRNLILVAVSMCAMLHSMSSTCVSVVLPQLQGVLSATPDQISWVITVAVVGSVAATPITGWLVDRLGWRTVMTVSAIGFAVSTFLCATAESLAPMLVYRTFQGAFGAPMIPVAQAILLATYPNDKRSWSQSVHGVATVVGQAMAPVIGGYMSASFDWRWSFFFLIPLSIVAIVMTILWLPQGGKRSGMKLDWQGFVSLAISIGAFQLMLDRGERNDWFDSQLIIVYAFIAVIGFVVFISRIWGKERPFIDLSLFSDRQFALGSILIILFGVISFIPMFVYPLILGNLKSYPDTTIGAVLFVRGLGLLAGFFVVAITGYRYPRSTLFFGFLLAGISGIYGIFYNLEVQYSSIAWHAFWQGFGVSLIWVPCITLSFATLPKVLLSQGSALFHLLRQVAMSVSVAVSVMIIVRTGSISYSELSWQVGLNNTDIITAETWDTHSLVGLAQLSNEIDRQSQMIGYSNAFVFYTVGCFVGMLLTFIMGRRR